MAPRSRAQDGGNLMAQAIEHAVQVDIDHPAPGGRVQFSRRALVATDTGVVDGKMKVAERIDRAGHGSLDLIDACHVGHVGHGVAALGVDEAGDALRIVGADIGDDYIQAVACKQPGNGLANARPCTGDQGYAARE